MRKQKDPEIQIIEKLTKSIRRVAKTCNDNQKLAEEYLEKIKNISKPQDRLLFRSQYDMYGYLSMLFGLTEGILGSLVNIHTAIDNLPDREEFDGIKKEMSKEVTDTLKPLQEVIDGEKKIRSRYNDIYE